MFVRLCKWLLVVPLVVATGGHWALLQTVAWVSMAARYSQDSKFEEALVKTFDGKHPCKLCKVVQQGKSEESKQDILMADIKLDVILAQIPRLLYPPPPFEFPTIESGWPPGRHEPPPTPPPRFA